MTSGRSTRNPCTTSRTSSPSSRTRGSRTRSTSESRCSPPRAEIRVLPATARRRSRLRRRLARHHLVLAVGTAAACTLAAGGIGPLSAARSWSLATAYVGLALLVATLLIGPVRVLRGGPVPLSLDVRRDVGIWAAIVGIAHVVFGLQVHLAGRIASYFVAAEEARPAGLPIRIDSFGLANYAGLAATAILLALALLSNDRALRALGSRRWKRIHRLAYPLLALVVAHGVAYVLLERRAGPLLAVLALTAIGVAAVQAAGFRRRRAKAASRRAARLSMS